MEYLLGIDNGLTISKAALFDIYGTRLGCCSAGAPLSGTEIDMERIWCATAQCIREVLSQTGVDPSNIVAVGNSGHGNGLYYVDKSGEPFMNALSSMTEATLEVIRQWQKSSVVEEAARYTLQSLWAGQPAAILAWLKRARSEQYKKIHKIMFCKDWMRYRLTGKILTDYTDTGAGGILDCANKRYSKGLFELLELREASDFLPELCESCKTAGFVTKTAAEQTGLCEGTPVAGGLFDVNACMLGSGVAEEGVYSVISGTWGINSCLSEEPIRDKNILQCCPFADSRLYVCVESAPTSSVNLEWFLRNVMKLENPDYKEADCISETFSAGDVGILYLPFVYPSMRHPSLGGGFYGLSAEHSSSHMLRSVFEGVALGHRLQIERLQKAGFEHDRAILSGGASNSGVWSRIFADVLGLEVEQASEKQSGALGAAICAAVAAGAYKSVGDAVHSMVKRGTRLIPDDRNTESYNKKYRKFKNLINLIGKVN